MPRSPRLPRDLRALLGLALLLAFSLPVAGAAQGPEPPSITVDVVLDPPTAGPGAQAELVVTVTVDPGSGSGPVAWSVTLQRLQGFTLDEAACDGSRATTCELALNDQEGVARATGTIDAPGPDPVVVTLTLRGRLAGDPATPDLMVTGETCATARMVDSLRARLEPPTAPATPEASDTCAGVGGTIAIPFPAATPSPVATIEPEPSPSPTAEPTMIPTATPTPDPTPVPTREPTEAPTATPSPSPTPAATPSPAPTATPTPTPEPTATSTPTPTATPSPQPTATTVPSPTATTAPTATPTAEPSPSPTATATPTLSPSPTATAPPEPTATSISTAIPSPPPSMTPEATTTPLPTPDNDDDRNTLGLWLGTAVLVLLGAATALVISLRRRLTP